MPPNQPPATVQQLLAKVTASVANIDKHRQAMAQVAATARPPAPPQPQGEVTQQ